jgi:hypothetical protein
MQGGSLGLMHFWEAGDAVTHSVAWLLLAMSVVSWYVILSKGWAALRLRRSARSALSGFWAARSLDEAMAVEDEIRRLHAGRRERRGLRVIPRGGLPAEIADRLHELADRSLPAPDLEEPRGREIATVPADEVGDEPIDLAAERLEFGRYQVFHRLHADGEPVFSLASIKEPGTFDPATMDGVSYRGVAMFAVLPGPLPPAQAVPAREALAVETVEV